MFEGQGGKEEVGELDCIPYCLLPKRQIRNRVPIVFSV